MVLQSHYLTRSPSLDQLRGVLVEPWGSFDNISLYLWGSPLNISINNPTLSCNLWQLLATFLQSLKITLYFIQYLFSLHIIFRLPAPFYLNITYMFFKLFVFMFKFLIFLSGPIQLSDELLLLFLVFQFAGVELCQCVVESLGCAVSLSFWSHMAKYYNCSRNYKECADFK